jgi:XTP/dITP diphosphohydrolase
LGLFDKNGEGDVAGAEPRKKSFRNQQSRKTMDKEKQEIVLSTRNHGKISEFRSLFKGMPVRILSCYDFPDLPVVVEDGKTFQENAEKKAKAIAKKTGRFAIADDSGLEVKYLDGRPGVFSARFSGENATDRQNTRKLLKLLESASWEEREARFVCVICVADPKGKTACAEGVCNGRISFEMKGTHGFGYDPIFVPNGHRITMAEMDPETKNRISHRAVAMDRFREILKEFTDHHHT